MEPEKPSQLPDSSVRPPEVMTTSGDTPANASMQNTNFATPIFSQGEGYPPTFSPEIKQSPTTEKAYNERARKTSITLARMIYIISFFCFLALGPGSIILGYLFSPYAWIVVLFIVPRVYQALIYGAPVVLFFAIVNLLYARKNSPNELRTVSVFLLSVAAGLLITWLAGFGIVSMRYTPYSIVIGAILAISVTLCAIFRIQRKKGIEPAHNEGVAKIVFVITMLVMAAELAFSIYWLIWYSISSLL